MTSTGRIVNRRIFALRKDRRPSLLTALAVVVWCLADAQPVAAQSCISTGPPVVVTDKEDYGPLETVAISGSGFSCNQLLKVLVTAPDGSTRSGSGNGADGPDEVSTDGGGAFALNYSLFGIPPTGVGYQGQLGVYTIFIKDASGTVLAGASFSDGQGHFSCALTTSGGVKCWGFNPFGQLGDGTLTTRNTPVDVVGLTSGVVQVSIGLNHACAIMSTGAAKCWGYNGFGQLGDGTLTNRNTPVNVSGLSSGVSQISLGFYHTCIVTNTGGAKCWGRNTVGQLGDGTQTQRTTPTTVSGFLGDAAQISLGMSHTCAVTTGGIAKCWGYNSDGQLGDGTQLNNGTPVSVSGISGVAGIRSGEFHTCAVTTLGGVTCWGGNNVGQLGDATFVNKTTPVNVIGLTSGVAQISVGFDHACARTTTGGAKCWGSNSLGQLGDATFSTRNTPVSVSALASEVAQISAGSNHTCVRTTADGAKCWGANNLGQLGDGTLISRNTPANVPNLTSGVAKLWDDDPILSNEAPVPKAGGPYSGDEGVSIPLNSASASDVNPADVLTYSWTVNSAICSFSNPALLKPDLTCDDNGNFTVTLSVNDGIAASVISQGSVTINNVIPNAQFSYSTSVKEGTPFNLSLTGPMDVAADLPGMEYAFNCGSGYGSFLNSTSVNCPTNDNGSRSVKAKIKDKDGGEREFTASVLVENVSPKADLSNDGPVNEGSGAAITFSSPADHSSVDAAAGFRYAYHCGNGSLATATYANSSASAATICTFANNGSFIVKARIIDKDDGYSEYATSVAVNNVAPIVTISGPQPGALVAVGDPITVTGNFTDSGTADTHSALWSFDNFTQIGSVSESVGNGAVINTVTFTTPGVYQMTLRVTDSDGAIGIATTIGNEPDALTAQFIVYDPNGGFVTGGGWLQSPAGALKSNPSSVGKATFGFVSKYLKGANVPSGQTEFQFNQGSFNFHSTTYQWLVVAGAKAQYKGTGVVNGTGDYGFLVTATDGEIPGGDGADKFRVKIWSIPTGLIVYDNVGGPDEMDAASPQALGGGNIMIRTK